MSSKESRPTLKELLEAWDSLAKSLFDLEGADGVLVYKSDQFLHLNIIKLLYALDVLARFTDASGAQAEIRNMRERAEIILLSLPEPPGYHSRLFPPKVSQINISQ